MRGSQLGLALAGNLALRFNCDEAPCAVTPARLAHACRQAPGEPGYGMAGIQPTQLTPLANRHLAARHVVPATRQAKALGRDC
jgi:hypothetical protein